LTRNSPALLEVGELFEKAITVRQNTLPHQVPEPLSFLKLQPQPLFD
jgi:hypothetical protein